MDEEILNREKGKSLHEHERMKAMLGQTVSEQRALAQRAFVSDQVKIEIGQAVISMLKEIDDCIECQIQRLIALADMEIDELKAIALFHFNSHKLYKETGE